MHTRAGVSAFEPVHVAFCPLQKKKNKMMKRDQGQGVTSDLWVSTPGKLPKRDPWIRLSFGGSVVTVRGFMG